MKTTLSAVICIVTILFSSPALAYSRSTQGYGEAQETIQVQDEQEAKDEGEDFKDWEKGSGGGKSGTVIWGYVLLSVGGIATIAGSTIVGATDHNIMGASIAAGGAALSLGGTLMIMLGSRGGYAVGPTVDPKRGNYGIVVAKRF